MTAAPEQLVARSKFTAVRKQRRGDAETNQRQNIDEAAERHGDCDRRRGREPSRQIEQQTNDRRQRAQRQHDQPDVIGRMANDRNVIGQRRLRRFKESRREQTGKSKEDCALPDPPERRGPHIVAGKLQRRDADEKGKNALQPDHQREHDVDNEALVEEVDRPERRLLHAGNPRQREQKGEHASNRERADGEPGPPNQLTLDCALHTGDGAGAIERSYCLRRLGHERL